MDLGTSAARTRSALVCVAVTVVAASLLVGLVPVLGEREFARFDQVLVWLSAAVAAAVTSWLWLITVVVAVDAARGLARGRRGVPEGVRRGLLVLCGVALTAGVAAPTIAAGGAPTGPEVLSGLRLPERIGVQPALPRARPAPAPAPTDDSVLVVAEGDTLWSLAADQLGPHPTAEEIAAAWPRLYAANRHVVGPDPSHIEPGQRLVLPAEGAEHDGH
jgi:hypothetical protein